LPNADPIFEAIRVHREALAAVYAAGTAEDAAGRVALADDKLLRIETHRGVEHIEHAEITRAEFKKMIGSEYDGARRLSQFSERLIRDPDHSARHLSAFAKAESTDMAAIDAAFDAFEARPQQRAMRRLRSARRW